MKRVINIALVIIFLNLNACGGGPYIKYNEDKVLKETTKYLEEKYGEKFEYNTMGHSGGTQYVWVSFYALDNPVELMFDVQWRDNGDITDNYELLKEERDERLRSEE